MYLQYKYFENTVGKGEIAYNEQFSSTHSVFYPFGKLSKIFIEFKIVICKTLSVWNSLKFVGWGRIRHFHKVMLTLNQKEVLDWF